MCLVAEGKISCAKEGIDEITIADDPVNAKD